MTPMFVFLASSFNVELVYAILKGITQFGYITLCEPESVRDKLGKMRMLVTEDNTELTFFEIKIKNYSNWDATSHKDFTQENWVKIRQTHTHRLSVKDDTDIKVIRQRVKVTFHMIHYFKHLYKYWGINDFKNFYESLSPKFNRDMVFKAGEGAGRSGSFFFFSHDQKFIIKTMTKQELTLMKKMMPAYS